MQESRCGALIFPKMGYIIPNMGLTPTHQSTADALFPAVLQRVLTQLFAASEEPIHVAELIRRVDSGTGAVHRVLKRLETCSLVTVERLGNQKLYRANPAHPVFEELLGLVRKTSGVARPLRDALSPLADRIQTAYVFGSVASGDETADSDVDLLVLSDDIGYADLYEVLPEAESVVGRSVNPHLETPSRWRDQVAEGQPFAVGVEGGAKIPVISSEDAAP